MCFVKSGQQIVGLDTKVKKMRQNDNFYCIRKPPQMTYLHLPDSIIRVPNLEMNLGSYSLLF